MIPLPRSYFDGPEKLALLRSAAAELKGTPFYPNSEAPGRTGGIDCVHTLNWLYRACGAVGYIDVPPQTMDYGQHATSSRLIEAFDTWPELRARFACIWRAPAAAQTDLRAILLPGDALCFLEGAVSHHGGVLLEHGDFLHCLSREGVHTMRLAAVYRGWRVLGRIAAVYRPLPLPGSQL